MCGHRVLSILPQYPFCEPIFSTSPIVSRFDCSFFVYYFSLFVVFSLFCPLVPYFFVLSHRFGNIVSYPLWLIIPLRKVVCKAREHRSRRREIETYHILFILVLPFALLSLPILVLTNVQSGILASRWPEGNESEWYSILDLLFFLFVSESSIDQCKPTHNYHSNTRRRTKMRIPISKDQDFIGCFFHGEDGQVGKGGTWGWGGKYGRCSISQFFPFRTHLVSCFGDWGTVLDWYSELLVADSALTSLAPVLVPTGACRKAGWSCCASRK